MLIAHPEYEYKIAPCSLVLTSKSNINKYSNVSWLDLFDIHNFLCVVSYRLK